jgi:glyoxylase-like metal-dependent hydrolase (beta-lactamase superfamily II)
MTGSDSVRVRPIVASRFALDGGAMFGIVPRNLWERQHPADEQGRIALVGRVLVARFPAVDRVALIDAGIGTAWSTRELLRYRIDTTAGDLTEVLEEAGVDPAEVTDVVLTHLHFDHAGGLARDDGRGGLEPSLPGARHHVQRSHLEWARSPSARDRGSFTPELIELLDRTGLLRPVDGEVELFPGLDVITSQGHTTGLQIPLIRGRKGTIAYPADLLPTMAHGRANWIMAYDLRPLETLEEKRWFLDRAAAEGWTVVLEHDPGIEAARASLVEGVPTLSPVVCPGEL